MSNIHPIPAFNDNYIWLLQNGDGSATVVDPGEAAPVMQFLEEHELTLATILLTHHHFDHVGGVAELKAKLGCTVYGPKNDAIAHVDHRLVGGDQVTVGDHHFTVIVVPGHTLDHIAYYQSSPDPLLFCGDTLFAGGCGRIFEGNPPMMYESLSRLAALPPSTSVYCAHEYTLANLRFARAADPSNAALSQRQAEAQSLREAGLPTLPSTIALELATNPFLRSAEQELRDGLRAAGQSDGGENPVETFAHLRAWKDTY